MNALIVDDEALVAKSIKTTIEKIPQIDIVTICSSFKDSIEKCLSHSFDIVLMDLCLGSDNTVGFELCKMLKKNSPQTRIIIITAYQSHEYLEKAFELGVEEYITKPFHPEELKIRLKRWLFFAPKAEKQEVLKYKDLHYNKTNNQFFLKNTPIELTKSNKILLRVFIENPENLLRSDFLQEKIWADTGNKSRNVRSNVQILRQNLPSPYHKWICTVRGEGYMLKKTE